MRTGHPCVDDVRKQVVWALGAAAPRPLELVLLAERVDVETHPRIVVFRATLLIGLGRVQDAVTLEQRVFPSLEALVGWGEELRTRYSDCGWMESAARGDIVH